MKICVIGAGAIGGLLGVKFAQAGHEVTLVARGANLQAIAADGMRLRTADGGEVHARSLRAAGSSEHVPPQDLVILGMKAHQVEAVAREIPRLCHAETLLLPMQNGIPWWYFQRLPAWAEHTALGALENRRVLAVDPHGVIADHFDPARIIGGVVYQAGASGPRPQHEAPDDIAPGPRAEGPLCGRKCVRGGDVADHGQDAVAGHEVPLVDLHEVGALMRPAEAGVPIAGRP